MINNYTRLIDNLQYLKLYEISEKLNSFDIKNNKDFIDQLLELTDCEVDVKTKRAKRIMIKQLVSLIKNDFRILIFHFKRIWTKIK